MDYQRFMKYERFSGLAKDKLAIKDVTTTKIKIVKKNLLK